MISKKIIEQHLEEIEYKAIACETNMQNLNTMLEDIKEELLETENENTIKTLWIQKEQLEEQFKTNEKALYMHEHNITFLKNKLWV